MELRLKKSLWVMCKILWLFVNPLTGNDKYSLINSEIFWCNDHRKRKYFLNFFLHFLNLDSILKIFKEKIILLALIFLNSETLKEVVRSMSKKPASEDNSTSNMVNVPKHCSKLNSSTFTIFFEICEGNPGSKSFSEWYPETQDPFTANNNYSPPKRCNLLQHFQI